MSAEASETVPSRGVEEEYPPGMKVVGARLGVSAPPHLGHDSPRGASRSPCIWLTYENGSSEMLLDGDRNGMRTRLKELVGLPRGQVLGIYFHRAGDGASSAAPGLPS